MRDRIAMLAVVLATLGAAPSLAQEQGEEMRTPEDRATTFVAVEGATEEDVPGGTLLVGAYGVAWVLLFAYLGRLARIQGQTRRQVEQLEASWDRP